MPGANRECTMSRKKISVVLPAYNEEENITPFHEALAKVFDTELTDLDVEFIFVNDGSQDATWQRIQERIDADPRVRAIGLSRNFGHQAALTAGLAHCTGDAIISMDCDFQDPPELIPKLVREWDAGNKIVYARRSSRSDRPFKKATAKLYYRMLSRVSDVEIPRNVGDFRLIDRVVLDSFLKLDEHARYVRGMIAWLGFKHSFVDFERPNRIHGETHYSLARMMRLAMDGLLNFSFSPLRVALWIGLGAMLVSVLFLLYMIGDILLNHEEYPLFKWLTVILFGFMGLQYMLVWVLGEYIGRIYNDVRRRPLYVVSEQLNMPDDSLKSS